MGGLTNKKELMENASTTWKAPCHFPQQEAAVLLTGRGFDSWVAAVSPLLIPPSPKWRLNMAFRSPLALISSESENTRLCPPGTATQPALGKLSI